jgi:hypothetical protein
MSDETEPQEDSFDKPGGGGAIEREIYTRAHEIGQEVVGNLTHLFPALAVPHPVLLVLQEMIQREVWASFTTRGDMSREEVSSWQLANDPGYINWAISSGLRYGEPIDKAAEEAAHAKNREAMSETLVNLIERHTKKKLPRLH